jgi:hypothetical protein
MLLQVVTGARLEAFEDFSIGFLDLYITLWMSNERIAGELECIAGILGMHLVYYSHYPWNALLVNWDPLSVMILFGTSHLQTMDLINLTTNCLLILTTGVASGHLVNLSMVTYRYQNPLMALGNGPRMSSPHTTNGHEGGIIYSICAGVWIHLAWN